VLLNRFISTRNSPVALGSSLLRRHTQLVGAAWTVLLAALVCWLIFTVRQGRLTHIDETFYKAAGYHWAANGKFAAPELEGRLPWDPPIDTVFACYPPVYPFVFGLYTWVVGFGWQQVALFDVLVHALLCVATAGLTLRMFTASAMRHGPHPPADEPTVPRWQQHWLACLAGLLVLPLGTLGRPDELAMLFAMAALALLLSRQAGAVRLIGAGALWGLSAATSIGMAIAVSPLVATIVLSGRDDTLRRRVTLLAIVGIVAADVLAACFVPLVIIHPQAMQQFALHSLDNTHATMTWVQAWLWAWGASTRMVVTMGGIVVTALLLAVACWSAGLLRQWGRLVGSALLGLVVVLFTAKGKGLYLWFLGPWLIASIVTLGAMWWHQSPRSAPKRRSLVEPWLLRVAAAGCVAAPMLMGALASGAGQVAQWLAVAKLPPGQTPADAQLVLDQLIPDGAVVLADDLWSHLASRCDVHDATFGLTHDPEGVLAQVQYVALTANYSPHPGQRRQLHNPKLEQYLADHFQVIRHDAGGHRLTILGKTLDSHAQGFGPVVLRKTQPSDPVAVAAASVVHAAGQTMMPGHRLALVRLSTLTDFD
jgi:hypothetical protein